MSAFNYWKSSGLTNADSGDLADVIGSERKIIKQTLCSSYRCQGSILAQKLVSDSHVDKCPNCGSSNHLFYKTTSVKVIGPSTRYDYND